MPETDIRCAGERGDNTDLMLGVFVAVQPAAEGPLAAADAALFAAGVPTSRPLLHIQHVLRELSGVPLGTGTTRPHAAAGVLNADAEVQS